MGKKLRSGLIMMLCTMMLISGTANIPVRAESEQPEGGSISVYKNGFEVHMGMSPEFYDDCLMVPLKDIAVALEAKIAWDSDAQEITIEGKDITVIMPFDGEYARVNGQEVKMGAGPVMLHSIIAVPVQFLGEVFGYEISYDEDSRRVDIDLPAQSMRVVSYFVPGDEQSISWSSLSGGEAADPDQVPPDLVTDLALGWYSMNWDGNLLLKSATGWWRPDGWEEVLDTARELELGTEMVIYMSNYDDKISKMISNPQAVDKALKQIVQEAQLYGGVNLDLEGLGYDENPAQLAKTRSALNRFVSRLSRQLQEDGKTLTLTLHPPNSIYRGYDYQYLGERADKIIVMAYDYGILPEPNALVDQALEMAVQQVPADKLLLGICKQNETRYSIKAKLELARRYQVDGVALWYWGSLDNTTWDMLDSRILSR